MVESASCFGTEELNGPVGIDEPCIVPRHVVGINSLKRIFGAHRAFVKKGAASVVGNIDISDHQIAPDARVQGIPRQGTQVGDSVAQDREIISEWKVPGQAVELNPGIEGQQMIGDGLS